MPATITACTVDLHTDAPVAMHARVAGRTIRAKLDLARQRVAGAGNHPRRRTEGNAMLTTPRTFLLAAALGVAGALAQPAAAQTRFACARTGAPTSTSRPDRTGRCAPSR